MKLRSMAIRLATVMAVIYSPGARGGGNDDVVLTPFGDAYLSIGQIVNGYYQPQGNTPVSIFNMWQQQAYAHIGYDALVNKKLDINISVGGILAFSDPQAILDPATLLTDQQFLINSAYASYPLIQDSRRFSLTVQGGYFPYKYNPDVRNLGEYLFRTNTYPMLVYSSFDYPQVRLLGARIGMQAFDTLVTNDILLHSEVLGVPVQDWSLGDVFNVHLFNMLDIGGGVDFTHLFSVYPGPYNAGFNTNFYDYYYSIDSANDEHMILRDTIANANGTKSVIVDTLNWKAIKLMGRFGFDPKNLLDNLFNCDRLGKDDFKLYGEADVIGVTNYPSSNPEFAELYNRNMRTLYSMGINIPTFGILDVANVEMEYCADTTSAFSEFSIVNAQGTGPILDPITLSSTGAGFMRSPWRWSIYVKKSVCNDHVAFIAQASRDHTKIDFNYWDTKFMSLMEALPASQNWWWEFKTEVKF